MAVPSVYVLHAIKNGSTNLTQISNVSVSPGIQTVVVRAAGAPSPLSVLNMKQQPGVTFTSTQLKTLLDLTGVALADLSANNTDLEFRSTVDGATRSATNATTGVRLRAAQAVLDVQSITASDDSSASASCRLIPYYDGTNVPIVPAGSVSLAAQSGAVEQYTLGPVFLNTGSGLTQLPDIKDVTIDFGRSLMIHSSDGELYPTFVAVQEDQPSITLRALGNPWASLGFNGLQLTAGSFYFRNMGVTGRVANGTTTHIKFACGNAYAFISDSSAGNNEPLMTSLTIAPSEDDPDAFALAVSTAIAITS